MVTPGFVTDGLGLALLYPPTRHALVGFVKKHITVSQAGSFHQGPSPFNESHHNEIPQDRNQGPGRQGETLDGEFERKD